MLKFTDQSNGNIDVEQKIGINYSYNKHPMRGYHYAITQGMEEFGCPELLLMDYYSPQDAEYILMNMADCVLNGSIYDEEFGDYDFYRVIELQNERGELEYRFGFIGGTLYGNDVICLQLLNEQEFPVHPGGEFLPSYCKRGFEPYPMHIYAEAPTEWEGKLDEPGLEDEEDE